MPEANDHLDELSLPTSESIADAMRSLGDYATSMQRAAESGAFESLAPPLQIALLLGAFAFVTTLLVSVTSFTRIVIVLSFVRRALTTQEIPPNTSLMALALFLTLFTMGPTFDRIMNSAILPYSSRDSATAITGTAAVAITANELRSFMEAQTRVADLELFMGMSDVDSASEIVPMRVLIPAFMISEFKTAFIMGFCIYIPFVLIDLLISTILMSLGMMMMPPVVVSAPIKLLLFVLVDGWRLIAEGLGTSFVVG